MLPLVCAFLLAGLLFTNVVLYLHWFVYFLRPILYCCDMLRPLWMQFNVFTTLFNHKVFNRQIRFQQWKWRLARSLINLTCTSTCHMLKTLDILSRNVAKQNILAFKSFVTWLASLCTCSIAPNTCYEIQTDDLELFYFGLQ